MQTVNQEMYEVTVKDQGEKFRTIIELTQTANDSNWTVIMDQIRYLAEQGHAYLVHFEDAPEEVVVIKPDQIPSL